MKGTAVSTAIILAVLLLLAVSAALATEDSWRVRLDADDGYGYSSAIGASLGVYPASVDGWDAQDGSEYGGLIADMPQTCMHVATEIGGIAYPKDIKAPARSMTTWDFFVAANVNSVANVIRLQLYTINTTAMPAFDWEGHPVGYSVRMVDNRGIPGAPANGTRWMVPVPTTFSHYVPFWNSPVNLPVIKLSQSTNAALLNEGYQLQLVAGPMPEPSSILALGAGALGLAGYAIRRRRG